LFLEYEWLQHHNPTIDWKLSCLNLDKYRTWCRRIIGEEEPEDVEDNIKEVEEEEYHKRSLTCFVMNWI